MRASDRRGGPEPAMIRCPTRQLTEESLAFHHLADLLKRGFHVALRVAKLPEVVLDLPPPEPAPVSRSNSTRPFYRFAIRRRAERSLSSARPRGSRQIRSFLEDRPGMIVRWTTGG
jgi:hypothetical protein